MALVRASPLVSNYRGVSDVRIRRAHSANAGNREGRIMPQVPAAAAAPLVRA